MEGMLQSFGVLPVISAEDESNDTVADTDCVAPDDFFEDLNLNVFARNGFDTVFKCAEAVSLFHSIEEKMYNDVLAEEQLSLPGFTFLFNCEDSLLCLASSGEVYGIFYANVLNMELENGLQSICRIFEHGCFSGFYEENKVDISAQVNMKDIIPVHVLNEMDVENNVARNSILAKKKGEKERRIRPSYNRFLRENKTSVINSAKGIVGEISRSGSAEVQGVLIYIVKKNTKLQTSESDDR